MTAKRASELEPGDRVYRAWGDGLLCVETVSTARKIGHNCVITTRETARDIWAPAAALVACEPYQNEEKGGGK